jgi:hypothetical protein
VTYDSRLFVNRNQECVDRDLAHCMFECQHSLAKVLFPEGEFSSHPLLLESGTE